MSSNPERLAAALDEGLDHDVRLILYGRAALSLGFDNPPHQVHSTSDIDAIIELSELKSLVDDEGFWDARDSVNERFKDQGLYITHLFKEDQVFLRPDWSEHLVPVSRPPTKHLRLFRPAAVDLILTKMMRGDDRQDMEDVAFLVKAEKVTSIEIEAAFNCAQLTDIQELHDAFEKAKPLVREIVQKSERENSAR